MMSIVVGPQSEMEAAQRMLFAMPSRPKLDQAVVTALMPIKAYDPQYLEIALNSLLDQSSPRWYLLAIAEPEDRTRVEGALDPWLGDARVMLILNEGARLAGAINTGMRHASTDFVSLLFADDLWAPQAVEVLSQRLEQSPNVDFFHSSRRIIDDDSRPISSVHRAQDHVTLTDFVVGSPVKHLLCWRRSFALAIGGLDERSLSVGPDDLDFPWTMAEHGAIFEAVDECLYIYRDHRRMERLTTHLPRRIHTSELRRILTKHGMSRREVRARVADARRSYLRQCLYRSAWEEGLRRRMGWAAAAWRDDYA
jgi:glycosyltransferase involved in cell wall biosynthesis